MNEKAAATIDAEKLSSNLQKLEELNQRFLKVLSKRQPPNPSSLGPGQDFLSETLSSIVQNSMENPMKIYEQQVKYWGESLQNWMRLQESLVNHGESEEAYDNSTSNKSRFKSEEWESNPFYKLVKDQYLTNANAAQRAIMEMEGVDDHQRQRLEFFSRQIVEMMSPANFLATNPDALKRAAETEGESLVRGLENLVRDLELNDGELLVTLADPDAFSVGENLATSKGEVIFRNELFELIQFAPSTEQTYRIPLLIVPPWINKYYILDLKPENSLIRWAVEQGFTVFIVSWVNPTADHKDIGMDDYASQGLLTAVEEVKIVTGEKQINAVGYCIGGTLLSLVLAHMAKTGNKSIRSATLFTTLTDFSELGELAVFIDNDYLSAIEQEVADRGYLPSIFMARTFSFMRATDLVYGPAIRSYLMGEAPPAFDLLYWNGDSTNLPAKMTVEYLRRLCQQNEFATSGFEIMGETVRVKDIRHPIIAIACEKDHIANWSGCYKGFAAMSSTDKTFILSQSGHIAGIINPPSRNRYGHYTSIGLPNTAEEWRKNGQFSEGSWWHLWGGWLSRRSGKKIESRQPCQGGQKSLGSAPGTYILANS